MNIDFKVHEIEEYISKEESRLQSEVKSEMDVLLAKKEEIKKKFGVLKNEAIKNCEDNKAKVNELCDKAKTLIDGIKRKLFKKQQRSQAQVAGDPSISPEYILRSLEMEIGRFEASSLPYGIRQFVDSVSLFFNSNYGQAEVDKIVSLYDSMVEIRNNGEFDKNLEKELDSIKQSFMKEMTPVINAINALVSQKVDKYISSLETKIFNVG